MATWEVAFQQIANGVVSGAGYALIAVGLTTIYAALRVINFAHGVLFTMGAMTVYLSATLIRVNYFVGSLLTIFVVGILGYLIYKLGSKVLKTQEFGSLLYTFAISLIIDSAVLIHLRGGGQQVPTPFTGIINLGPVVLTQQKILILVVSILTLVAIYYILKRTKFGKSIRAVSQTRFGAALVGVNLEYTFVGAFVFASALAGMAGALMGPVTMLFPLMGISFLVKGFAAVIIGGLGSIHGAIVGAFTIGLLESLGAGFISSTWVDVIVYSVIIIILLVRPHGLFGKGESG